MRALEAVQHLLLPHDRLPSRANGEAFFSNIFCKLYRNINIKLPHNEGKFILGPEVVHSGTFQPRLAGFIVHGRRETVKRGRFVKGSFAVPTLRLGWAGGIENV